MSAFTKIFAILIATMLPVTELLAAVTFPISGWDKYDGSERLGTMQEQCGDGWPQGYTARQAIDILAKKSRSDAGRMLTTCDPKELEAAVPAPQRQPEGAAQVATPHQPANQQVVQNRSRIEHPFQKMPKDKQYRCWIDANGRHRVGRDDPKATGWCWGKAVGDE